MKELKNILDAFYEIDAQLQALLYVMDQLDNQALEHRDSNEEKTISVLYYYLERLEQDIMRWTVRLDEYCLCHE